MHVDVVGVALTDVEGSIVDDLGTPAYKYLNSSARQLDQSILRNVLERIKRPLIVVGENTWGEMKQGGSFYERSYNKGSLVFVSNSDYIITEEPWEANSKRVKGHPSEDLVRLVFSEAISKDRTVLVLGGHSVYRLFYNHYTLFYHNIIKDGCLDADRHIDVMVGDENVFFEDSSIKCVEIT